DQHGRAAHETAACRPVQFGNAGLDAWCFFRLAGKGGECDRAALLRCPCRTAADTAHRVFLDDRIPLAAAVALAGPAAVDRAAVLAHELGLCFRHVGPPPLFRVLPHWNKSGTVSSLDRCRMVLQGGYSASR